MQHQRFNAMMPGTSGEEKEAFNGWISSIASNLQLPHRAGVAAFYARGVEEVPAVFRPNAPDDNTTTLNTARVRWPVDGLRGYAARQAGPGILEASTGPLTPLQRVATWLHKRIGA